MQLKKLILEKKISKLNIKTVVHLAAQAGVRYSLENPRIYMKYNIDGFMEVLEYCRSLIPSIFSPILRWASS